MHEQDRFAALEARIAELEARLAQAPTGPPAVTPEPSPPSVDGQHDGEEADPDPAVERRRLLRRSGTLVAGALAGGAALTLLDASPAAAATVVGSGDPGVSGSSAGSNGVYGLTTNNVSAGVLGETATVGAVGTRGKHLNAGVGVHGTSAGGVNGIGVQGDSAVSGGVGVRGNGTSIGVFGNATGATGTGVAATSTNGHGVEAVANGSGSGVRGTSATGIGVDGQSNTGIGVRGTGASNVGVKGTSTSASGVVGETTATDKPAVVGTYTGPMGFGTGVLGQGGIGVQGEGTMGAGILGTSLGWVGGHFSGGAGNVFLMPQGASPVTNTAVEKGVLAEDANGDLWLAVVSSPQVQDPGVWRKLAGPETAGSLHLLPAPKRVYDSRVGNPPLNVTKGAFVNQTRVIDATNNGSGVPLGATGVLVQFAVTNTNSGGFGTLYAVGQPDPGTASINWGLATSLNNTVVTAVDANGDFNCKIAGTADVILDVVGYYR